MHTALGYAAFVIVMILLLGLGIGMIYMFIRLDELMKEYYKQNNSLEGDVIKDTKIPETFELKSKEEILGKDKIHDPRKIRGIFDSVFEDPERNKK